MFTGLIEEIGSVAKISGISGGKRITINASKIGDDLAIDHSVSVNGVCLTVVDLTRSSFTVEVVGETLTKSTITRISVGDAVNLERAIKMGDRFGGHIVQGHVNGIGTVKQKKMRGDNMLLNITIPHELEKYVIAEGSIAIEGISLTIAQLNGIEVGISVIPHTYNNTTLKNCQVGQQVNIETDFLAKYVEKMITPRKNQMTEEWLKKMGY